ncbi:MOSC domain-containing protein [Halomonas sp.]|uniref:MOSC domain-containing protein n=1 Tax=Halomonas sp. TaxID=1486246 RepID=UPI0035630611
MRISQLNIYPVKSLQGIALETARLTEAGLALDRNWMLVDDIGRFVTQRELPAMARIAVSLDAESLVLTHPDASPLRMPLVRDDSPCLTAYVWEDRCEVLDEGPAAARWLTGVLGALRGSGLRLVRLAPEHRRRVEPHFLRQGERPHTAFADGYPFLVASEASLGELNRRLDAKGLGPVPMSRFRPNIVIDGETPFAEDGWEALVSADGTSRLGLRKPCQRCKITTVDQHFGEIREPGEPLRTLVEMNPRVSRGGFFGQNAILLDGEGEALSVGDRLEEVSG